MTALRERGVDVMMIEVKTLNEINTPMSKWTEPMNLEAKHTDGYAQDN